MGVEAGLSLLEIGTRVRLPFPPFLGIDNRVEKFMQKADMGFRGGLVSRWDR